ncbi:MAG: ribonuclease N1 [Burkholderiaceae bacterium]|jgi:ribonuclease T1|nr:ribonuclease N1 [Burkholderiaceae bacterium]
MGVRASAVVGLVAALLAGTAVQARGPLDQSGSVSLASLPPEARTTHRLILAGGPFPYRKDGTVFGNRERLLPRAQRGFYREYTVPTPGSRDRGARRIVCGGERPTAPEACFYTADHYASFKLIAQ